VLWLTVSKCCRRMADSIDEMSYKPMLLMGCTVNKLADAARNACTRWVGMSINHVCVFYRNNFFTEQGSDSLVI